MQETNQVMQQDEDEISLIDLLVVLLKHRFLIIGITLIAALGAGLVLFGLPAVGLTSYNSYTVQATASTPVIPPALRGELGIEPINLALSYSKDINAVAERVISNNLAMDGLKADIKDWKFRTYISRSFIGKEYKVTSSGNGLTFEVTAKNAESAKAFLNDMISYTNDKLCKEIASRSTVIAASMENLYKDAAPTTSLSDSAKQLIISSRTYMTCDLPALVISSQPEILVDPQGRSKTAIIVVMAAFFLSIFAAFVVEYAVRVKSDPESWGKIQKALGKA